MADRNTPAPRRIIRASELAQYAYCAKAWWLGSVDGVASTNTADLERGTRAHQAHGRTMAASRLMGLAAIGLLIVAIAVFLLR